MTDHASFPEVVSGDQSTALGAGPPDSDAGPGSGTEAVAAADAGLPGLTETQSPEPIYLALEDWVLDYFLPMFRRTLGGEFRWCAQWWRHGEAVSRLNSLWHAWEALRWRPGIGMATWYREHLDHQLPILMGARGPFYQCSEAAHREPHEAIAMPSPDEWWDRRDSAGRALLGAVPSPMPAEGPGAGDDGD
jgi:Domain of unknown function (DUF4913)